MMKTPITEIHLTRFNTVLVKFCNDITYSDEYLKIKIKEQK